MRRIWPTSGRRSPQCWSQGGPRWRSQSPLSCCSSDAHWPRTQKSTCRTRVSPSTDTQPVTSRSVDSDPPADQRVRWAVPGDALVARQLNVTEHQTRVVLELVTATTGSALNGTGRRSRRSSRDYPMTTAVIPAGSGPGGPGPVGSHEGQQTVCGRAPINLPDRIRVSPAPAGHWREHTRSDWPEPSPSLRDPLPRLLRPCRV